MLDRREFLRRSLFVTGGAALLPPSMVWPHKKIFVPEAPKIYAPPHLYSYGMNMRMEWNDNDRLWTISGDSVAALYLQILEDLKKKGRL